MGHKQITSQGIVGFQVTQDCQWGWKLFWSGGSRSPYLTCWPDEKSEDQQSSSSSSIFSRSFLRLETLTALVIIDFCWDEFFTLWWSQTFYLRPETERIVVGKHPACRVRAAASKSSCCQRGISVRVRALCWCEAVLGTHRRDSKQGEWSQRLSSVLCQLPEGERDVWGAPL